MKLTFLYVFASFLLLFNSFGALYGGWNFITHPDGSSMQMSLYWLEHTPFNNYLIPGIILFVVNGLFSLFTFIMLLLKANISSWLVLAQGIILAGWIVIQMILIQTVIPLHIIMGIVAILMFFTGRELLKAKI